MIHILHINDYNLVVQSTEVLARSQGYAWIKDGAVMFDCNSELAPIKSCRLEPQQINSRYWQQCEQSSIASNSAGMRHAADLIWRHLSELKSQYALGKVLLVVPSHYQAANLQLLLGIAKSCGIEVVGLLNKAIAAVHDRSGDIGEYLHVDVQLHQSVCTRVIDDGKRVSLGDVDVVQSVGIQAMQDAALKAIQEKFIQNDRFDPLHYAETEQQIFDQLNDVAKQVQELGKATITVQHQERLHRISIDSKLWSATLTPLLQKVLAQTSGAARVFIDLNGAFHNSVLPDLVNKKLSVLAEPPKLNASSLASDVSVDEPLIYQTEMPKSVSSSMPESGARTAVKSELGTESNLPINRASELKTNSATHLLHLGVAVPISRAELRTETSQLSLHEGGSGNVQSLLDSGQIFIVNDEPRRTIALNDRLGSHLADGVITVIRVV